MQDGFWIVSLELAGFDMQDGFLDSVFRTCVDFLLLVLLSSQVRYPSLFSFCSLI